jgi:hypothetical protein
MINGLSMSSESPLGLPWYDIGEVDLEHALRLASLWEFQAVRVAAISRLESLDLPPARLIQLARQYDVKHWFSQQIERLVLREGSLTMEETRQIGPETAVNIASYRDARFKIIVTCLHDTLHCDATFEAVMSEVNRETVERITVTSDSFNSLPVKSINNSKEKESH